MSLTPKTVLVVDDSESIRESIGHHLKRDPGRALLLHLRPDDAWGQGGAQSGAGEMRDETTTGFT